MSEMWQEILAKLKTVRTEAEAILNFASIADQLMNRHILVSHTSKLFRLQTIEFYLSTVQHMDLTSHNNERQYTFGRWYVHRCGKRKSSAYATFNPKVGLDLTLGASDMALAVLIRNVYDLQQNLLIQGPIRSLNALYGLESAFQSHNDHGTYLQHSQRLETYGIWTPNPLLYLKSSAELTPEVVAFGKRVGLNSQRHPDFAGRHYQAYLQ